MAENQIIEKGQIYFFYRCKMDVETPGSLDDIARFEMILMPAGESKGRLLVIGKKRLPEIAKGESKSRAREWMMNIAVTTPEKLGKALGPVSYETKTRGKRREEGAVPVGEGGYAIVRRDDRTELAYRLKRPEQSGEAQEELGILREACFVIAVRNPEVKTAGFPDEKPDYPKKLREMFADERWLDIADPKLLDYEKAQFLLVGARDDLSGYGVEIPKRANLFKTLDLKKAEWPTEALEKGRFAAAEHEVEAGKPKSNRTKGGQRGGKAAVRSDSAAGVAKALKGIEFPTKRQGLVRHAGDREVVRDIIELLKELPDRNYKTMADVQKALGEVR